MIASGQAEKGFFILHGGAGPMDPSTAAMQAATASLTSIALRALQRFRSEQLSSLALSTELLMGLESDEAFNAGFGAALQQDGDARVSAALMDGRRQRFSGVIGLSRVKHPSQIALAQQDASSRVLGHPGAEFRARELGLPPESLVTNRRLRQWHDKASSPETQSYDTVGVVICDQSGHCIAGTSTGGRGFEYPGRVSDSATVAGNYASQFCAISATGIGEEIVDDALCARLETRVRDGLSLSQAAQRCFQEANAASRSYGWIAVGSNGAWSVAHTTPAMSFVIVDFSGHILAASQGMNASENHRSGSP